MFVFRELAGSRYMPVVNGRAKSEPASAQLGEAKVLRVSMPTPAGWFYVNIRFGRERRSLGRLAGEGQVSVAKLSLSYTLAMWIVLGLIGLGVMVGIYLVKSVAGIDLLHGPSFLHDFIY